MTSEKHSNKIMPGMLAVQTCLYIEKEKTLILSDLHFGQEQSLVDAGTLIPFTNFKAIMKILKKAFEICVVKKVIVTGDLKHAFGQVNAQEWRDVKHFVDFCKTQNVELIVIEGNHDPQLHKLATEFKFTAIETGLSLLRGKMYVLHGDKIPVHPAYKKAEIVVMGHEHPAITLREGQKKETFKCFLKGLFKGKTLIVLPSTNQLTIGSDVLREQYLSPFLQQDLSDFKVWILEDSVYYFGMLKDIS